MNVEGNSLALLILSGNQEGKLLPLQAGEEIVIGRMEGLDLVLPEDLVSRRHARIAVHEEGPVLRDLGSTNGTFVNGKRVREVVLREGDRILLGATILSVVPNEELLLPSGSSLSEALAAISAGPSAASQEPRGGEVTGAGEEEILGVGTGAGETIDAGESMGAGETTGAGEALPPGSTMGAGGDAIGLEPAAALDSAEPAPGFPPGARLGLAPGAPPLSQLTPSELDLLQIALLGQPVERILEQAAGVEDAPALLRALVDKGYLALQG